MYVNHILLPLSSLFFFPLPSKPLFPGSLLLTFLLSCGVYVCLKARPT